MENWRINVAAAVAEPRRHTPIKKREGMGGESTANIFCFVFIMFIVGNSELMNDTV